MAAPFSFLMHDVPALSQLRSGSGGDRCGETCLTACLQSYGLHVDLDDVLNYFIKRGYISDSNHAMSYIGQLVDGAIHFGAKAQIVNTQEEMHSELRDKKHATVALLYNAFLDPLPYPHQSSWYGNHYVVVEEWISGGNIRLMDPLAYPGSQQVSVSEVSFLRAVQAIQIQQWGFSVWLDKPVTVKPNGPKVCP